MVRKNLMLVSGVVWFFGGTAIAAGGAPTIVNGDFVTDHSGWETSTYSGWLPDVGPDGIAGVCHVNNIIDPGAVGWIQQNIAGLIPSTVYRISGSYKTKYEWYNGPSFAAQIDGIVRFQGGFQRVVDWTPFEFEFVAADTDAMLRFEAQVGGTDSDYVVDKISITSADVPTVSEWGIVVMTLLTLVAGTIILVRPRLARG